MRYTAFCGALCVALLFSNSSPVFSHTDAERREELMRALSDRFDPEWITSIFNHQNACTGNELPIERLSGGWPELERRVMTRESVLRGVAFFNEHANALTGTAFANRDTTNTLPFVTVAILRIESDLGENRAGVPVVETLYRRYAKAADGPGGNARRHEVLERQLIPFLTMAWQNAWVVCEVRGTRAAAFGFPHFIPESLRLAEDGDGDGKIDLMWNLRDAIASIGNYLEKTGWHRSTRRAVFRYNPDERYVRIVMRYAKAVEDAVRAKG